MTSRMTASLMAICLAFAAGATTAAYGQSAETAPAGDAAKAAPPNGMDLTPDHMENGRWYNAEGIPTFTHDSDAIAALGQLAAHCELMRRKLPAPRALPSVALPEGKDQFLSEWQSMQLLEKHGLPTVPQRLTRTPPLAGGRRPLRDLVLYELMIDDCTAGERGVRAPLDAVRDRLDHLVDLGVSAILFMPWTAWTDERFSWGYTPALYYSVSYRYANDLNQPTEKLSSPR